VVVTVDVVVVAGTWAYTTPTRPADTKASRNRAGQCLASLLAKAGSTREASKIDPTPASTRSGSGGGASALSTPPTVTVTVTVVVVKLVVVVRVV
jgi:hypothetical protein